MAAACAPDLDLLVPLLGGAPCHRGPSHSLGAALLCGGAVLMLARLRLPWADASRLALLAAASWASHVVLDWLGSDSLLPLGLMALWPWSDGYYVSPVAIFMDVGREASWRTLVHNSVAMAWETVLLAPVLLLVRRARRTGA